MYGGQCTYWPKHLTGNKLFHNNHYYLLNIWNRHEEKTLYKDNEYSNIFHQKHDYNLESIKTCSPCFLEHYNTHAHWFTNWALDFGR